MSYRTITSLVLGLAVFGGFMWAHYRYDEQPEGSRAAPRQFDAEEGFRRLMRDGLSALEDVRASLNQPGFEEEAAKVADLLPSPDEAWVVALRELAANPPKPPFPIPEGTEIVQPSGLLVPGNVVPAFVRRAMPGRVMLTIQRTDRKEDPMEAEVAIGRWENLPQDVALLGGGRYRITARPKEGGDVAGASQVEILDPIRQEEFREKLLLLKRYVPDLRVRLYAHAVLAMSHGLYLEAAEILFHRLPPPRTDDVESGLEARLAFLYRQRGSYGRMSEALRRLARN